MGAFASMVCTESWEKTLVDSYSAETRILHMRPARSTAVRAYGAESKVISRGAQRASAAEIRWYSRSNAGAPLLRGRGAALPTISAIDDFSDRHVGWCQRPAHGVGSPLAAGSRLNTEHRHRAIIGGIRSVDHDARKLHVAIRAGIRSEEGHARQRHRLISRGVRSVGDHARVRHRRITARVRLVPRAVVPAPTDASDRDRQAGG